MFRTAIAYTKAIPFLASKYMGGYDVPSEPWFDDEGKACFSSIIRQTEIYLEYGCGGSTVEAARHAKIVVSVESDPVFIRSVKKLVGPNVHFVNPRIGLTREYGFPVNANAARGKRRALEAISSFSLESAWNSLNASRIQFLSMDVSASPVAWNQIGLSLTPEFFSTSLRTETMEPFRILLISSPCMDAWPIYAGKTQST